MTTTPTPEDLQRMVRESRRVVVSSHMNPDGDAIGAEVALARILRKLGKSCVVWNRDPTPPLLESVPGAARIHVGEEPPGGFPDDFDVAILLECPSVDRTGLESSLSQLPMINVDHHMGNELFGVVNWVDSAAPAVGEMVLRLARSLKVTLDPETATALYLTLVTDTGDFRFSNAGASAFDAAAQLVREGAEPARVAEWLHQNRSPGSLRLLGEMLRTLELHEGERLATVEISQEMFERAGAVPGDTEGLIDHPRAIRNVQAVVLLRETPDRKLKVSLRSRGEINVESLARREGGGGHRNAAGFTVVEDIAEVKARVLRYLADHLD